MVWKLLFIEIAKDSPMPVAELRQLSCDSAYDPVKTRWLEPQREVEYQPIISASAFTSKVSH